MTNSECFDDCAYDADFLPRPEMNQLPFAVKGRLNALKNLQLNAIKAESEYYQAVKQLDIEFQAKFDEINQQRAKVIDGSHEPSGPELEWHTEQEVNEDVDDLSEKVEKLAVHPDYPEGVHGIPKFWLHVFKNANEDVLMGFIEPHDEEVLAYMTDVSVSLRTDGFMLHFHFKENPFFTNQVLTKDYTYREGPDPKTPLMYEGPEIVASKGCSIDWKEGKDLTKLTMKVEKLAKTKDHDDEPESVPADSFFDFFDPPCIEDCEEYNEYKADLSADFEVGLSIKEKILPRAVLYFTGEVFDDDGDDNDSEASDSEEQESGGDAVILSGSRRSQKSKSSVSKS